MSHSINIWRVTQSVCIYVYIVEVRLQFYIYTSTWKRTRQFENEELNEFMAHTLNLAVHVVTYSAIYLYFALSLRFVAILKGFHSHFV